MKYIAFLALLLTGSLQTFAQKPPIDTSTYNKWATITPGYALSNDGKYFMYYLDYHNGTDSMIVGGTQNKFRRSFRASKYEFTSDSQFFIIQELSNEVALVHLGTHEVEHIKNANNFNLAFFNKEEKLIYLNSDSKQLTVRSINSKTIKFIDNVVSYQLNESKTELLLTSELADGQVSYRLLDLVTGDIKTIFVGAGASNFIFDDQQKKLLFLNDTGSGKQLWFYQHDMEAAKPLLEKGLALPDAYSLENIAYTIADGQRLILTLKNNLQPAVEPAKKYNVPVTVWSYNDTIPRNRQQTVSNYSMFPVQAVLDLTSQKLNIFNKGANYHITDNYAIVNYATPHDEERGWNRTIPQRYTSVLSYTSGREQLLQKGDNIQLGTGKRFVIYFDQAANGFFSFEVSTGIRRFLTKDIQTEWENVGPDLAIIKFHPIKNAASPLIWTSDDQWVLVRDRYDIWQLDPSGKHPPINLTNGYGKKHHICLQLATNEPYFTSGETLMISAFNYGTNDNGFFKLQTGVSKDPVQLTMGPYAYYTESNDNSGAPIADAPVKAKDANAWIVLRQSASDYPNLFYTENMKTFKQVTDLAPQKKYNWMTSELHHWTTPDGIKTKGILYKPENFDPHKKYPVIFYYYELKSNNLRLFRMPEPAGGDINFEWYVSHGYLMFVPDFYYLKDKPFESSLHTLTSAVTYLKRFSFVDVAHLGIQGKSWGGIQTNYFVTHSHLFAAACSASSISDLISYSGQILKTGWDLDDSQLRVPGTLWTKQQWFVNNSAVLNADKVTTPLLMMQNTHDQICPFVNAFELFTALRRLGKKAWMLEYGDGIHGVDGASAMDYDQRMQQFFDHYLKGAPAPKWMVEGIPARLQGIESGLELEPNGIEPGLGLVKTNDKKFKKHKR